MEPGSVPARWLPRSGALAFEVGQREIPIEEVIDHCRDVGGALLVLINVVRVLPHVDREKRQDFFFDPIATAEFRVAALAAP